MSGIAPQNTFSSTQKARPMKIKALALQSLAKSMAFV